MRAALGLLFSVFIMTAPCACSRSLSAVPAGDDPVIAALPVSAATAPADRVYVDPQHTFRMAIPPGFAVWHDFSHSYLDTARWKAFAEPGSHGEPLLDLQLPGSNAVTTGQLRIGVSDDPHAVALCGHKPRGLLGKAYRVNLNGAAFSYFRAGRAAMSHYFDVESWRTVHAGRCYAIDLMVNGTVPQVYNPPATPPFTRKAAFAQLRRLLDGFQFTP